MRFISVSCVFLSLCSGLSFSAYADDCFKGFVPTPEDNSPTGFCWNGFNKTPNPDVSLDVHYDLKASEWKIGGLLVDNHSGSIRAEYFDYVTLSCTDTSDIETVVKGANGRDEQFRMVFTREKPTDEDPQRVGTAKVEMTLGGVVFSESIPCKK